MGNSKDLEIDSHDVDKDWYATSKSELTFDVHSVLEDFREYV